MLIKNIFFAEEPIEQPDDKEHIRRVSSMYYLKIVIT